MTNFQKGMAVAAVVFAALAAGVFFQQREKKSLFLSLPATAAARDLESTDASWVVAPGIVEPLSRELFLGFDVSGVIGEMLVEEGDKVEAGQPLVLLKREEQAARLAVARANVEVARADDEMHRAGARLAEKEKARAALASAEVRQEQADREVERRQIMIKSRSIGIEELERALRDAKIARHDLDEAKWQFALVNDWFRDEEQDMARRRLEAAEAQMKEASAALEKTVLRAPVSGTILRVFSEPGEAYSVFAPSPVLSMGDTSVMRVRVEVDERDVARIKKGQKAYARADAFGDRRFSGVVSKLEQSMTPKRTRTGDPSEPIDRSVLEVLLTLDEAGGLYSGLRVDAFIQADPPPVRVEKRTE